MNELETKIILIGEDVKLWAVMNALKDLKVFQTKFGSVTIHFDGDSRISNLEIKQNHRVVELLNG